MRVRACLSKTGQEYFSFLSAEGCERLSAYLEGRIEDGEAITDASPIVRPKTAHNGFIRTPNISHAVRGAVRRAGFPWRPYLLRSYFATQMMLAESKGLIIRDYRQHFMGHKGDIEAVYTLRKRQLPSEVVAQMRQSYGKASRYLHTDGRANKEQDVTTKLRRQLLMVARFAPEEITEDLLALDDEGFQKVIREQLQLGNETSTLSQRVIPCADIEEALLDGWDFLSALPDGRAVMTRRFSA